jgi:hypothetical protein
VSAPSIYRPWEADGDCPAPWAVEDTDLRVHVNDAQGGLIADCTNGFDGDDGWVMSAACGPLANLIAAAPDLLEALRAFMALDRDFATASDRHLREIIAEQRASAPLVKAVIAARAAIAKATGAA